jgi:hypothetical protein
MAGTSGNSVQGATLYTIAFQNKCGTIFPCTSSFQQVPEMD